MDGSNYTIPDKDQDQTKGASVQRWAKGFISLPDFDPDMMAYTRGTCRPVHFVSGYSD